MTHTRFSLLGVIVQLNHEDTAPAPVHIVLIAATVMALLLIRGDQWRLRFAYTCCVIGSFLLFCAILKWQPWNARLHLPMLVLACPVVGVTIETYVKGAFQSPLILLVLLASLPNLTANKQKPLVARDNVFTLPRETQYFLGRPDLQTYFESVAAKGVAKIGLAATIDAWEYPLWVLARQKRRDVRIEHVNVQNYTAPFAEPFEPDAIVSFDDKGRPAIGVTSTRDDYDVQPNP